MTTALYKSPRVVVAPADALQVRCPQPECSKRGPVATIWHSNRGTPCVWVSSSPTRLQDDRVRSAFKAAYLPLRRHDWMHHRATMWTFPHLHAAAEAANAVAQLAAYPGSPRPADPTTDTCLHCSSPLELHPDGDTWIDAAGERLCTAAAMPCERLCRPHNPTGPDACTWCNGSGVIALPHEPTGDIRQDGATP